MNYIIITLLLIIILLNLKDDKNKEQIKEQNKNKKINGGYGGTSIKNIFILFFALTAIMYLTGVYIIKGFGINDIDSVYLFIISCSTSIIVSIITVLFGAYSYSITKFLIIIAIILCIISTYIDTSALLSYQYGCAFEPLFNTETIEEDNDERQDGADDLGTNFMYTANEWNSIIDNPQLHNEKCMAMHNRSHIALKSSNGGFMGRLNPFSYSITSWIGYILNYMIVVMVMLALSINENTDSMNRLNT